MAIKQALTEQEFRQIYGWLRAMDETRQLIISALLLQEPPTHHKAPSVCELARYFCEVAAYAERCAELCHEGGSLPAPMSLGGPTP